MLELELPARSGRRSGTAHHDSRIGTRMDEDLGFRIWGLGLRIFGLEFRIWSLIRVYLKSMRALDCARRGNTVVDEAAEGSSEDMPPA